MGAMRGLLLVRKLILQNGRWSCCRNDAGLGTSTVNGGVLSWRAGRHTPDSGLRRYDASAEEESQKPRPFQYLETTFGSLQWEEREGDFQKRLEKEPVKEEVKPVREAEQQPFVSLWSRFIEEEGISDFTDLDAIRSVAQRKPYAQTLVDITCGKITFLQSLGIGSYFQLDRVLTKLDEDDQVVEGDTQRWKENVEWLEGDVEFDREMARKLIVKNPKLLMLDLETQGMPLVTLLRERLLLKDPEIPLFLLKEPILLTAGVAARLEDTWRWLQSVGGVRTKDALRSILIRTPRIYSTNRFLESKHMDLNYEFLVSATLGHATIVSGIRCHPTIEPFEKKRVARAIFKCPRVLLHDLEKLKETQMLIKAALGVRIKYVRWLFRNRPRILILDTRRVVLPRIRLVKDVLKRNVVDELLAIYQLTFVPMPRIMQRLTFLLKIGKMNSKWKVPVMFGKSDARFCKEIVRRDEEHYSKFLEDFTPSDKVKNMLFPDGFLEEGQILPPLPEVDGDDATDDSGEDDTLPVDDEVDY